MAGDQGPLSIAIAITEPTGITFTGPPFLPSRTWPVTGAGPGSRPR